MNMKEMLPVSKLSICLFLCFALIGCGGGVPKGFLKPSEGYLEKRELQMRQYDTKDEEKIILAVAGVLQDLGFIINEGESNLGLIVASKKADATDTGQIAGPVVLGLLFGIFAYASAVEDMDTVQEVRASVVVKPSLDGNRTVVRVTFQRIVWNAKNQIKKVESIGDSEIYEKFYDSLSKAIFLEAHKI